MCIVCYPVYDVIKFEFYVCFLIKLFSYLAKTSEQKLKYLMNEKSFQGEKKSIFHQKGPSAARNCLGPESAHLNSFHKKLHLGWLNGFFVDKILAPCT